MLVRFTAEWISFLHEIFGCNIALGSTDEGIVWSSLKTSRIFFLINNFFFPKEKQSFSPPKREGKNSLLSLPF